MNPGRRRALRVLAGSGAAAVASAGTKAAASVRLAAPKDALGMLYDTTLCIGCKACVVACREANGLEADTSLDGIHQAPLDLNGRTKNVIKLFKEGPRVSFFKAQCMHCIDPACASACMLGSLRKDPLTGVVEYDAQYCVGCRYCQVACPFNIPKFEFTSATPKIVKCELCRHRVAKGGVAEKGADGFSRYPAGQGPACCEVCPRGAVIYGRRAELLDEAHRRMQAHPDRYVPKVYGETDAGGTQVLYLSHVAFEKLGLPSIDDSVPAPMRRIQHGLYQGFVAPVALYAALGFVMLRNRRGDAASAQGGKA